MDVKEMYNEWKALKTESINYQRAGIDDMMTDKMRERDTYVYNRIKEIETQMFPNLPNQEKLTFNNTPIEEAERQQDRFYTGNYLVNWIKIKEDISVNKGLVSGEVIYAPKP
jgi:hypothetical protein